MCIYKTNDLRCHKRYLVTEEIVIISTCEISSMQLKRSLRATLENYKSAVNVSKNSSINN